jgi:putative MATE family efflux protein
MESVNRQGTEPVGRLLLRYSLPAIAGFLVNALYQFVDRVLVGRGVGTEAMAAVTSAFPVTILSMGVGLMLGTGTGNQISTYLGTGRKDDAERVLGQSLRLAVLVGGILAVVLVAFARPVLILCGASGEVLEMAIPYLRITSIGQVFLIGIISMGNILRVQGKPNLGLAFMAGGNVLNAVLATLAIFVLHWGIVGAALATAFTVVLNFLAIVAFVQSPASHLRIRRRWLVSDPATARTILKLGAPILLMQILGSLVFVAANHSAAALDGPRGVAVLGVFNVISMLLVYPSLGVAQAMQPLVAYNRGASRPDRVRSLLGRSLVATTAMGVVFSCAVLCAPRAVASLFTRTDFRLVDLVAVGLPWFMISVVLFGVQGTASHYFLSVHRPKEAGLLLLGRQILAIIFFLWLPRAFGFAGFYLVPAISDIPMAILAVVMLRGEWKKLSPAGREEIETQG